MTSTPFFALRRLSRLGALAVALCGSLLVAMPALGTIVGQDDFQSYGQLNPAPDPLDGSLAGGLVWNYIDGQLDGIAANDHRTFNSPGGGGAGFGSLGWVSLEQNGGIQTAVSLASLAGSPFDNGSGGVVNGASFTVSFVVAAETSNTASNLGFTYDISASGGSLNFQDGGSLDGGTTFGSLNDMGMVTGGTTGKSDDRVMSVNFSGDGLSLSDTVQFSITRQSGNNNPFIIVDDFTLEANDGIEPLPKLVINRDSGNITLQNNTIDPVANIIGYSVLSDAGSLDQTNWNRQSAGSQLANDNDDWTRLTAPGVATDLSESVLATNGSGDGGDLAGLGGAWNYGDVWIKSPFEDVALEVLLDNGDVLRTGAEIELLYEGNNDLPFAVGDLNTDGAVDVLDWNAFQNRFGTDLTGLPQTALYLAADLDLDGSHTLEDFRAFEIAYDAVNGAGAFQSLLPEPTSTLPFAVALFWAVMGLRKRPATLLALVCVAGVVSLGATSATADVTVALYDAGPAGGGPADIDPTLQGWTAGGVIDNGADQNVFFLQPDVGSPFNAMQINDQGGLNPRYDVGLDAGTVDNMFFFGWTMEFRWRPIEGGTFSQWGVGPNNPWSASRERVGFSVSIEPSDNSAVVAPTNGATVNLGANSADDYHLVRAVGSAQSPMYELFINDVSFGMQDLTSGTSNSANDNVTGWQSGSSAGTGRVGNYNYHALTIDTPDLLTLTVNTNSGAAVLSNDFDDVLDVDAYSIVSAGSLTPGSWNPLENNPTYGNGTAGDGVGFEVIASTASHLAEADLTGSHTFAPGDSVSIGNIFSPGMPQDLSFTLGLENGAVLEANVVYVQGISGDFDGNGDYDCPDVDALVAEIAAGSNDAGFDLTGDGAVDGADLAAWLAEAGAAENASGNPYLPGDANLDGVVDVSDFNIWNSNKFGGGAGWCGGDFNADGVTDVSDFNIWNSNKFSSSDGAAAVPEPTMVSAWALAILLGCGWSRSRRPSIVRSSWVPVVLVLGSILMLPGLASVASAEVFIDRIYRFGDDSFENGAVGDVLGSNVPAPFNDGRTVDSMGGSGNGDFQDLLRDAGNFSNAPVYVDTLASGRPGATAADRLGVYFDGDGDGVGGRELNSPNDTWRDLINDNSNYPNNWSGIFGRGIQLWVRPDNAVGPGSPGIGGGLRQDIVTDTGEHGIYISEDDRFGLLFDDQAFESSVTAIADRWTHVMQRTLSGAFGGALLVDGVAVAARGTFYDPEDGPMSVGSDATLSGNFYRGEVDEMTMFVWGDNSGITPAPGEPAGRNWGDINLGTDNDWIRNELASMGVSQLADVNLDGAVTNADVSPFIDGWRSVREVDGIVVGDWVSRQNGDLNYDGIVDLQDAFILHDGLLVATGQGLDFSLLPEPSGATPLLVAWLGCWSVRRRRQER